MCKIIIMAGGDGTRWNNHLGVPKHFIPLDGETLIHRTIRKIQEHGIFNIVVIGPPDGDIRYSFDDIETLKSTRCGPAAIYELFIPGVANEDGRTIMLFGDVWYSQDALDSIFKEPQEPYTWYGREGASTVTGHPYGELWAISFSPEAYEDLKRATEAVKTLYEAKIIRRAGGWETYRYLRGFSDLDYHEISWAWCEINDFTEDFDCQEDFDRWVHAKSLSS